jgi:inhibitor of cysteine peptidase
MKKLSLLIVFMLTFGMIQFSFAATDGPYPDVPESHINSEAIQYLTDEGVIEGYPDGDYKPANDINRAEFTKIVMGPLMDDMSKGNCFPDVTDQWFAPYVCEAKDRGVIEGYPDGNFKPANEINFSEASKIVANAYGVDLGESSADPERWYKEFVTALEEVNAIPLSVEFFDENITRDEMAEMIYRLDAEEDEKGTRTYDEIIGEGFVTVDSCAELQDHYDYYEYNDYYYYRDDMVFDMVEAEEGVMAPAEAPAPTSGMDADMSKMSTSEKGGGGGADEYSTTNVQVEGVDEADIIKNDGKYIYLIKGDSVRIVEAYPAENLEEIVSFQLGDEDEDFYPTEMYVDEDTMVVIGSTSRTVEPLDDASDEYFYPYYISRSKVFVVDISDRAKPSVTRDVEFDGNYNTSRRIGDTLYMVLIDYPHYYYRSPADLMPLMRDSKVGEDELVAGCTDVRILPKPQEFNFLITAAIPLNDLDKPVDREIIAGDAGNVFASLNNLYVSATDWSGGYYKNYWEQDSALYKFELGDGTVEFKAKGRVPGTILNQFSMDEHEGNFRVATTENEYEMGSEITNNLYIFDEDLELLGDLENIAPGEKIYSVRFMGDRAYMVTFKRVDPLFVIDVSDPTDPEILGELKIPGYSTYLHPYDENHLLGFGVDVDEDMVNEEDDFVYYDAVQGMKIGMFDVTDVNHPEELYTETIGDRGTYSELLDNHKALLFDKEKELLAFPVTVYEMPDEENCADYTYSDCPELTCIPVCVPSSCSYDNGITVCTTDCDGENSCISENYQYPEPVFDGAYVYNVTVEDGFELKGTITHYGEDEMTELEEQGWTNWEKGIKRMLYMGEVLYSVSYDVVKANDLNDLDELNMVELAGDVYDIYRGFDWKVMM